MKNITNLILTFLISTQFVFAKHTEMSGIQEVFDVVEQYEVVSPQSHKQKHKKFLKLLDKAIVKSEKAEFKLENVMSKIDHNFKLLFDGKRNKTEALLSNEKKLKRLHKKALKHNPDLSYEDFVSDLRKSMSDDGEADLKEATKDQLRQHGSLTNFLKDYREKIIAEGNVGFKKMEKLKGRVPANGYGFDEVLLLIIISLVVLGVIVAAAAIIALTSVAWYWVVGGLVGAYLIFLGISSIKDAMNDMRPH